MSIFEYILLLVYVFTLSMEGITQLAHKALLLAFAEYETVLSAPLFAELTSVALGTASNVKFGHF